MASGKRTALMLLATLTIGLGCAGLFPEEKEDEPTEDTSEAKWEDTAARKRAKAERIRKKKLANQPKRPTTGPFTVQVKPGSPYTAVEVVCTEGGYRKRCAFKNNRCTLQEVPLSRDKGCRAFFQGNERASWGPIAGGTTLVCSFNGARANCTDS